MANEPEIDYERVATGLWNRIVERCIIEGCRYTAVPLELNPNQAIADKCIWCDEPRKETGTVNLKGLLTEIAQL